jgi:hypothetical protein
MLHVRVVLSLLTKTDEGLVILNHLSALPTIKDHLALTVFNM